MVAAALIGTYIHRVLVIDGVLVLPSLRYRCSCSHTYRLSPALGVAKLSGVSFSSIMKCGAVGL